MEIGNLILRVESVINSCKSLRQVDIAKRYSELAIKQIENELKFFPNGITIQFNIWLVGKYEQLLNKL